MRISDFKEYVEGHGFELKDGFFHKGYTGFAASGTQVELAVEYQVKRPWIFMYMVDSIGRRKKTMKAKISNLSFNTNGQLVGFKPIVNRVKEITRQDLIEAYKETEEERLINEEIARLESEENKQQGE